MAYIHGKDSFVSVDADNLTTYVTNVEFAQEPDVHDVTTMGKNSKVYKSGLKDATVTLEGFYDNTAGTGPGAVLRPLVGGAAVELIWQPEGTGSSKPQRKVDVILKSFTETAPVADMVTWSAEFQCSDDIDDTAQAA